MLQARIIPCLLLQDGGLVKTKKFKNPTYIGDPINAVKIFNDKEVDELDEVRLCAIGEATADRLRLHRIHVDVVPTEFKAEGVFSALTSFIGGREQLQGLNVLLPRAAVARDYLPKALEDAGARVDVVTAYRTVVPENLDRGRLSAMLAGDADCIALARAILRDPRILILDEATASVDTEFPER